MPSFLSRLKNATGFISGVLIGLTIMTPVFAAASPSTEHLGAALTLLATLLLVVGLTIKAAVDSRRTARVRAQKSDRDLRRRG